MHGAPAVGIPPVDEGERRRGPGVPGLEREHLLVLRAGAGEVAARQPVVGLVEAYSASASGRTWNTSALSPRARAVDTSAASSARASSGVRPTREGKSRFETVATHSPRNSRGAATSTSSGAGGGGIGSGAGAGAGSTTSGA